MRLRFAVLLTALGLALSAPVAFAGEMGDCNGDGVVDASDEQALLGAMGTGQADDGYIAECDHNGDGAISAADLGDQRRLVGGAGQ